MEIDHKAMKALLDAFDNSDWQEMTVTVGADRLHVSRQLGSDGRAALEPERAHQPAVPAVPAVPNPPVAGMPPSAPDEPEHVEAQRAPHAATVEVPATGTVVASPSVGLFWRAPSPGAPPFVEEGATVAEGDTVAIVEVMKLMNHVVAPVAGVVTKIFPDNGEMVEYGQPLIVVDPAS